MSKSKLIFIGAINEFNSPDGGEEYKNQLILENLKMENVELQYFDTKRWKTSPILLIRMFSTLLFSHYTSLIISASSVSTYQLLRVIYYLKPGILNKTTYLVIGGYFPKGIRSKRFNNNIYNRLKGIVLEGEILKNQLKDFIELTKMKVVPNFKKFHNFDLSESRKYNSVKFVFIGRINDAKGVNLINEATQIILKLNPAMVFEVDYYGPEEQIFNYAENNNYKGYLDFNNNSKAVYTLLNAYDCLLFPTYWHGEGFPGVIIDAFIAGLPIIASDWNMNSEIVKDGINGFIIPPKDVDSLAEKMIWIMEHREEARRIGDYNKSIAHHYHIDTVWGDLMSIIQ